MVSTTPALTPSEPRLLLILGGVMYVVSPMPDRPAWFGRAFVLKKTDGKTKYLVTRGPTGDQCDCPSFRFGGGGCKHVAALESLGLL